MVRAWNWVCYGFSTCLGLALIGMAAICDADPDPKATSTPRTDAKPPL